MIPLDAAGCMPVPEVASKQDGSSKSAPQTDQADFSRWLVQEPKGTGSDASPRSNATDSPLTVVSAFVSPDAGVPAAAGVLYAWQLHSQQFLSQLSLAPQENDVGPRELAIDPGASQTSVVPTGLDLDLEHGAFVVPGEPPARGTPDVVGASIAASIKEVDCSSTRSTVAGAVASTIWTERMLRSIELPNRTITLWLRDYRLDQSDIPATVDELLRTHPDRERVARVLVNGHEAWREQPLESRRK